MLGGKSGVAKPDESHERREVERRYAELDECTPAAILEHELALADLWR